MSRSYVRLVYMSHQSLIGAMHAYRRHSCRDTTQWGDACMLWTGVPPPRQEGGVNFGRSKIGDLDLLLLKKYKNF
jgi:hypothetical protein